MPTGTRVHNCVEKLKQEGKTGGSPYAICQSATGQSFATGKPLKKSFMSRSQAAAFLQSKIPILIEMALDGAWGAFQDYWIDTLDEIPQRQVRQKDSGRDAQVFAMYVQNSLWLNDPNPRADIERSVRSWVNWTINELLPDSKSLKTKNLITKTKSMEYNDAERFLNSQIPMWARMIEDGAFGPLYDSITEAVSDIGLRGAESYVSNQVGAIRLLIPRRIVDDWEAFLNTRSGVGADLLNRLSRQLQQDFRNRHGMKSLQTLRPVVQEFCNYFGFSSYQTSPIYAGQRSVSCFSRTRGQIPDVPEAVIKDWFEDHGFGVQWVAFHPEHDHLTIALKDSDTKSLKTKGLTAKTKSFNRGQAEQMLRQKLPLLIELAKDGAWDPFHDVWTDILHDIGDPYIGDVVDDVHSIRRSVESGNNPETVIQIAIRLVLRDAERYWRENPQGHRTKGLTANDARQIIQAKEPLLIQIAEAGAWYALQDQLEDLLSELGLDGFCNPKNGVNQIKIDIQRDRDTAVQAVQGYRRYLEICTEQYGTKSLKVKTKSMQYNFRTALAMVQDRQLDILHDYLTECAEDRGVENVAGLVDYHMRMIREVMREVPANEWPNWSATRGYVGTVIRNELADFEHALDHHGTKSFKVKTKHS